MIFYMTAILSFSLLYLTELYCLYVCLSSLPFLYWITSTLYFLWNISHSICQHCNSDIFGGKYSSRRRDYGKSKCFFPVVWFQLKSYFVLKEPTTYGHFYGSF